MISKASKRMYMPYVLRHFRASEEDLTLVFRMYVRPIREYASPLWHSSLTKQQSDQLELI